MISKLDEMMYNKPRKESVTGKSVCSRQICYGEKGAYEKNGKVRNVCGNGGFACRLSNGDREAARGDAAGGDRG